MQAFTVRLSKTGQVVISVKSRKCGPATATLDRGHAGVERLHFGLKHADQRNFDRLREQIFMLNPPDV
jgi:hypothetical protein